MAGGWLRFTTLTSVVRPVIRILILVNLLSNGLLSIRGMSIWLSEVRVNTLTSTKLPQVQWDPLLDRSEEVQRVKNLCFVLFAEHVSEGVQTLEEMLWCRLEPNPRRQRLVHWSVQLGLGLSDIGRKTATLDRTKQMLLNIGWIIDWVLHFGQVKCQILVAVLRILGLGLNHVVGIASGKFLDRLVMQDGIVFNDAGNACHIVNIKEVHAWSKQRVNWILVSQNGVLLLQPVWYVGHQCNVV